MNSSIKSIFVLGVVALLFSHSYLYAVDEPASADPLVQTDDQLTTQANSPRAVKILTPQDNGKLTSISGQASDLDHQTVSFDYTNANLQDVLKAFAYSYNLNIVLTKDIQGKVSAQVKDQPMDEALEAILNVNNYGFTRKGNIIYVMLKSEMDPVIESVPINFLGVKEAKDILGKASAKGEIQANESTNSLIVRGTASEVRDIKEVIKSVDVPPIQVLIEAKIVDINKSDIENIDTAIGLIYDASTTAGGAFVKNTPTILPVGTAVSQSQTIVPFKDVLTGDAGAFTISKDSKHLFSQASINALVKKNKARILASPSITTLNGKEASITIGEKFPYQSSSSQNGSSTTSNITFAEVGTKLKVTPTISSEGWITLKVHPEVSSVKAIISGNPNIATREADAIVRVRDNETIIIGGLISKSDLRDNNGIPYLKDIPLLGKLFQGHSSTLAEGELMVFITPHIIPMPIAKPKAGHQATTDVNILKGLMDYADSMDKEKIKDKVNNLYWSQEMIATYRSILQQFPESGKTDYFLYKIALIYAKDFGRCAAAKEALNEMKAFAPQSPYVSVTEPLVNACAALDKGQAFKRVSQ